MVDVALGILIEVKLAVCLFILVAELFMGRN
jgi:hypothetical protein